MKISAFALLGIFGVVGVVYCEIVQGQELARTEWESGNHHEYVIVSFPAYSWDDAFDNLSALLPGFHLATITSQEEQDFVNDFLLQEGLSYSQWWLGGVQIPFDEPDPEKGWTWVTGEAWNYTNWGAIEPNDGGSGEYHLALDRGWWNDEGSAISSVRGYIAESLDPIFKDGFEG